MRKKPYIDSVDVWGHPIKTLIHDEESYLWYSKDSYKENTCTRVERIRHLGSQWQTMRKCLSDSDLIFDIGANQGFYSCVFSKERPNAVVVAVEPCPNRCSAIRTNASINGLKNIIAVNASVGANTETLEDGTFQVTIDDLARMFGVPDVVKMDIEGAEGLAINGSEETLGKLATRWNIETHHSLAPFQMEPMFLRLKKHGYNLLTENWDTVLSSEVNGHWYAIPPQDNV